MNLPPQTQEIISKIKQALRAEFNARILSLEEEVSRLSSLVQSLTQQVQRSSVQLRRPQHSAPTCCHVNHPLSTSLQPALTNLLPMKIGMSRVTGEF